MHRAGQPFPHFVWEQAISRELVASINQEWPSADDTRWYVEKAGYVRKAALMFPQRLPPAAQELATLYYGPQTLSVLSDLMGIELLPDPWFLEGQHSPRVGGGLHEIGPGGLLGIHTDFDAHPTGLTRAVNLLIYLNEDWQDEWGGELELHGATIAKIAPRAGTAIMFETNGASWHGHPHPLACPPDRSRRSLALYYYRQPTGPHQRKTTVYRR